MLRTQGLAGAYHMLNNQNPPRNNGTLWQHLPCPVALSTTELFAGPELHHSAADIFGTVVFSPAPPPLNPVYSSLFPVMLGHDPRLSAINQPLAIRIIVNDYIKL